MLKRDLILRLEDETDVVETTPCERRRGFLRMCALLVGGMAIASPASAKQAAARTVLTRDRILSFQNPNTGESFRDVYWSPKGGYNRQALRRIAWMLRDHRNDQTHAVDPKLLDQMYALKFRLGANRPLHAICGYRSSETNEMLRETTYGVAKNSLHCQGKAVDLRMPSTSLSSMRKVALSLNAGGVGYYPGSNFIHIDTGPVRTWS